MKKHDYAKFYTLSRKSKMDAVSRMTAILDNCRSPSAGLSGSKPLPIAVSFLELALGEGKAAKRIIATVHDGAIDIAKGRHLVLSQMAAVYSAGKRGQF